MILEHIVAVVTGGASGLGEACVRLLTSSGARAAIWDTDEGRGERITSELGGAALFCRTDVTDENSVRHALEQTIDAFGLLNVLVNCAGIAPPAKVLGKRGPLDLAQFERVVHINLVGTMNVIRLTAERMAVSPPGEDGERGVIVNTASIAAFEGQIGQAAYSASKAGVVGLTLPVARELAAYGIRVVTIAPGLFETPMMAGLPEPARKSLGTSVPFPRRLGQPTEFAALVRHIIENRMLNGAVLRLDGALRMSAA